MSKKLWGGRFTKETDKDFFEFQKSIHYDYKLAEYDICHSLIHVNALHKSGLLKDSEYKKLTGALAKISEEIKSMGKKEWKAVLASESIKDIEDIHTYIQNKVEKNLGPRFKAIALKLHTLRSRNDQIVFDEKYECAGKARDITIALLNLEKSLLLLGIKHKHQKFIGYTHTQRAQLVLFTDYIYSYAEMFNRDIKRCQNFYKNLVISVGAGALAGSSSIDKDNYTHAMGKILADKDLNIKVLKNSIDTVSDRDFIAEFLSVLCIIQMHLSRLAEDMILYSTREFNLIDLPEEFCTGSSLMPHKKNPDFLELVRGYTGRIYGNLVSILTMMKGLPLSYNRDMQLDKEPLFSSIEIVESELKIMAKFATKLKLKTDMIDKVLESDKTLYATKLAEWLVREQKIAFKQAHDIVGRIVIMLERSNGNIEEIDAKKLAKLHFSLNKEVLKKVLSPKYKVTKK